MNTLSFDIDTAADSDAKQLLVPRLWVDGALLADFSRYAVDLNALAKSKTQAGEFFLLTCWCGVPDCVGIHSGIRVSHAGGTVRWQGLRPFAAADLAFEAADYARCIEELLAAIPQRAAELEAGGATPDIVPYGCEAYLAVTA